MTKVEELRENVLEVSEHLPSDIERQLKRELDSLISAARAEGKAEGAEQMKAEIRKCSEHYHGDPCVEGGSYYVVLDSVLAPTKEVAG